MTTRWGYDGLNMIAEYNGSNALLRRHVFAPGLDQPIVTYEGSTVSSTTRRFLSADERGSIIAVSDSTGVKLSTNGYDEYGIPQSPASATAGTAGRGTVFGRFGYTGQAWLPEVGLYYYKARVYSPGLGRFLQTDPIGYADQANLYAYVMNDPMNFTDPLGLQCNPQQVGSCNPIPVTACQNGGAMPYCVAPLMDLGIGGGGLQFADMNGGEFGGRGESDQGDEKKSTCSKAIAQPGKVKATGITVTAALGIGWTVTRGSWSNLNTGAHGKFTTYGFAAGLDLGAHVSTMTYDSMQAFTGWSDGWSAGVSVPVGQVSVGGSASGASNDSGSGSGGSLGVSPGAPLPSVGASGNFTETTISQCQLGR